MADRHVVPADDGWQVEKADAQRASAKAPTQAEAVERATEIVANSGGGAVIVHGADGEIRRTRTVEAAAEKPGTSAVTAKAAMVRAGIHAADGSATDNRAADNRATDGADRERGRAEPQRTPRAPGKSGPGPSGGSSGWVELANPVRLAGRVTGWAVATAFRAAGGLGARARRHLP